MLVLSLGWVLWGVLGRVQSILQGAPWGPAAVVCPQGQSSGGRREAARGEAWAGQGLVRLGGSRSTACA